MKNVWDAFIQESETKTIVIATFYLTKSDIINALHHDYIIVYDRKYKLPKKDLLELLIDDIYGMIEFELELIE